MKKLLTILILSVTVIKGASAQNPAQNPVQNHPQSFNLSKSGLAIGGYDPVAYFTSGKPIEGKKENSLTIDGVNYLFSTSQNKELFKANPAKYQPQYGGWCAYAMGASGEKVDVDPETFKILDGKLYLFYNKFFNNTLRSWNKDEPGLKTKADANWVKINQRSEVFVTGGKAIKGYDPVAFFTQSKPVKGQDSLMYNWKGADWLFSSRMDLESFRADPEKYAPQYGGYCAFGTSQGHKAPSETDTWSVVNNKLYFNYNMKLKALWVKDQPGLIEKADRLWPELKDK